MTIASGQAARSSGARIVGVVSSVPARRVDNAFFAERFGDKVAEVVKMTGVLERRWVDAETTTSDLCKQAGVRLLEGLGWAAETVDALIFVSQTPDYRLPATACTLQHRLGLRTGIVAFDVGLGCSGYPYGLWLASMMIQTGAARRVLLAVGDTSSIMVDPDDRGTALLFGDAGTMTAIEEDADGTMSFILGTDGAGAQNLIVQRGGFRNRGDVVAAAGPTTDVLHMDGGEVFNFTLQAVPQLIRDTIAVSGEPLESFDAFLLHQANQFMIRHLAKKAKLPADKVPINIDRFGNTSSATIPLLMTTDLASALAERDLLLGMFGFGVGYSWGSVATRVGPLRCVETLDL